MRSAVVCLTLVILAAPATAQSLLDRVQGLYYPNLPGAQWDCRTLGGDGGALGIQGNQMIGVENICTLSDPFPIPGMDAIRFNRTCTGEGVTYDAGPILMTPSEGGVILLWDGFVTEWLRCG